MTQGNRVVAPGLKPYCIVAPDHGAYGFICGTSPEDAAARTHLPNLRRGAVIELRQQDANHTHRANGECIVTWIQNGSQGIMDVRNIIARSTLAGMDIMFI